MPNNSGLYRFGKFISTSLILLLFSAISANATELALSEGCRDCVRGYDCNTMNTRCNATCSSKLFTDDIDLESCRFQCIKDWEKCNNSAKSACSFYCKE